VTVKKVAHILNNVVTSMIYLKNGIFTMLGIGKITHNETEKIHR
jgi:hypothetical protein